MSTEGNLSPRVNRHVWEHKKLQTKADQVAVIHLNVDRHSVDHSITELQKKSGFSGYDLTGIHVWTRKGAFTVILVPLRLWYRPIWKRRAIELKNFLRRTGKRCIIAPASYLDHQPRLQNACLVAASKNVQVSTTDRIVLMAKIDEEHFVSLGEASSCLTSSKDPAAAVLNLVGTRALSIDPDHMIGPHSMVTVRCR